jgi:hypothetical protein
MSAAVRRPLLTVRKLSPVSEKQHSKRTSRHRRTSSWGYLGLCLVISHACLADGMTLTYPDGTQITGTPTVPRGRRVLLGFQGEYAAGKNIREGDTISIVDSTKNCAESDDISNGVSRGVAVIKVSAMGSPTFWQTSARCTRSVFKLVF